MSQKTVNLVLVLCALAGVGLQALAARWQYQQLQLAKG